MASKGTPLARSWSDSRMQQMQGVMASAVRISTRSRALSARTKRCKAHPDLALAHPVSACRECLWTLCLTERTSTRICRARQLTRGLLSSKQRDQNTQWVLTRERRAVGLTNATNGTMIRRKNSQVLAITTRRGLWAPGTQAVRCARRLVLDLGPRGIDSWPRLRR